MTLGVLQKGQSCPVRPFSRWGWIFCALWGAGANPLGSGALGFLQSVTQTLGNLPPAAGLGRAAGEAFGASPCQSEFCFVFSPSGHFCFSSGQS